MSAWKAAWKAAKVPWKRRQMSQWQRCVGMGSLDLGMETVKVVDLQRHEAVRVVTGSLVFAIAFAPSMRIYYALRYYD